MSYESENRLDALWLQHAGVKAEHFRRELVEGAGL